MKYGNTSEIHGWTGTRALDSAVSAFGKVMRGVVQTTRNVEASYFDTHRYTNQQL